MKAILVIETDAKHIEDLYVEHIWNDFVLIDLGKEYHFKPMPEKMRTDIDTDSQFINGFRHGFNTCIEIIETNGENYVVQEEE